MKTFVYNCFKGRLFKIISHVGLLLFLAHGNLSLFAQSNNFSDTTGLKTLKSTNDLELLSLKKQANAQEKPSQDANLLLQEELHIKIRAKKTELENSSDINRIEVLNDEIQQLQNELRIIEKNSMELIKTPIQSE